MGLSVRDEGASDSMLQVTRYRGAGGSRLITQ